MTQPSGDLLNCLRKFSKDDFSLYKAFRKSKIVFLLLFVLTVSALAEVKLIAEFKASASSNRQVMEVYDEGNNYYFDFFYAEENGTWEQRPGGHCHMGENNDTYLKMGIRDGVVAELTYQFSWDDQPIEMTPEVLEVLNSGFLFIIKTDATTWPEGECGDSNPPEPHLPVGETAWLRVDMVLVDGSRESRSVSFKRIGGNARDDYATVLTGISAVVLDLTENDGPGTRLSDNPIAAENGNAEILRFSNCCISYEPNPGFSGTDIITYQGREENGDLYQAQVTVEVIDAAAYPGGQFRCSDYATNQTFINVIDALQNREPSLCDFRTRLAPNFATFGSWQNNRSQNHIVKAVAAGLRWRPYLKRDNITIADWVELFLKNQTGEVRTPGVADLVHYKGGSELTSADYEGAVATAVAAMHYWATRVSDEPSGQFERIAGLSGKFLRQTAMMYALVAGNEQVAQIYSNVRPPFDPDPLFNGYYLALAGMRSPLFSVSSWNKNAYFLARSLNRPRETRDTSNFSRHVYDTDQLIRDLWLQNFPTNPENYMGTTSEQRGIINQAIMTGPTPEFLDCAADFLGKAKTSATLHLFSWPGIKGSLMEKSLNSNTVGTHGVVYYKDGPNDPMPDIPEASVLHAYNPGEQTSVPIGTGGEENQGTLLLGMLETETKLKANHGLSGSDADGHPEGDQTIDGLPAKAALQYHVILSRNANPRFETSSSALSTPLRDRNNRGTSYYLNGDLLEWTSLGSFIYRLPPSDNKDPAPMDLLMVPHEGNAGPVATVSGALALGPRITGEHGFYSYEIGMTGGFSYGEGVGALGVPAPDTIGEIILTDPSGVVFRISVKR